MSRIKHPIINFSPSRTGDETAYLKNGQLIVRKRHNNVSPSKKGTLKQLRLRTTIKNPINVYRAFDGNLNGLFTNKTGARNDYHCFIGNKNGDYPVYFTKQQAQRNFCIAAPYKISEGNLKPIVVKGVGVGSYTNILLDELRIDKNTTIEELSKAIVSNNNDFEYNDEIWYFSLLQIECSGVADVKFALHKLVLNPSESNTVWSELSKCGFSSKLNRGKNYLAHGKNIGPGVFAWLHVRHSKDGKQVSTQSLINNNTQYLRTFGSETAFMEAAKSYGYKEEAFLFGDNKPICKPSLSPATVLVLRINSAPKFASAIGSIETQANFVSATSMPLNTEADSILALEILGSNLKNIQCVEIALENGEIIHFDVDDDSTRSIHSDEEIIVYTAVGKIHSSITEVTIDNQSIWQMQKSVRL